MTKIVFMRFGPPTPILEVHEALKPHFANDPSAKAIPFPGGVMSIFETESTPEKITEDVKATGVPVPFFVFPYSTTTSQLPANMAAAIGESAPATPARPTYSVDQLLEKISATGMESLTAEEKAFLEANSGS